MDVGTLESRLKGSLYDNPCCEQAKHYKDMSIFEKATHCKNLWGFKECVSDFSLC